MKSWKAELTLIIITFVWGATFSFTKIGLMYASPLQFTFFRFSLALLISLLIWGRTFLDIPRKQFINGAILGLFYAGGFILQTLGLNFTTVTKSAFITGLSVAFTPFVYKFVENKKITSVQWLAVAVVVFGLWLLTNPKFDSINLGDVLTFISTFFWAFYIVYLNIFTINVKNFKNTMQIVISQFLIVFLSSLIGFVAFEYHNRINLNLELIGALLYNGLIATILLTTIHTSVQKFTTPIKAALIFSLEPVFASIFAFLIFKEVLTTIEYFGALLMFSGVIISEFGNFLFIKKRRINFD